MILLVTRDKDRNWDWGVQSSVFIISVEKEVIREEEFIFKL